MIVSKICIFIIHRIWDVPLHRVCTKMAEECVTINPRARNREGGQDDRRQKKRRNLSLPTVSEH